MNTKDLDDDFYDTLRAYRRGEINSDDLAVCCLVLARDYAKVGDWERVGHMLLNISSSFYKEPIQAAATDSPLFEECVCQLAELLVDGEQVTNRELDRLVVDLS